MKYAIWSEDVERRGELGGKAGALASLHEAGLPIPPWFALSPRAFEDSLTDGQRDRLSRAIVATEIASMVAEVRPSQAVCDELAEATRALCDHGQAVAVRSSAMEEDGAAHSFAGQFDSFLFVDAVDVPEKVAAVWRSAFSERVLAYRREHGLSARPAAPAVLVQRMVAALASGVAFGADPVTGRRRVVVVSAVPGIGSSLVSGDADADTFTLDGDDRVIDRRVTTKRVMHRRDPLALAGVSAQPVPREQASKPAVTDEQLRQIAQAVRRAGRHFGRPQDVEWAIDGHVVPHVNPIAVEREALEGEERGLEAERSAQSDGPDGAQPDVLYVLQSRPITALEQTPDPDGMRRIWDNANIAESYAGITTPLTFSFARRAYESVYRQFCRVMKVGEAKIAGHADTFGNMLGLIRGRVYYNLLNWYRVLALLPGFTVNRRFMEQMMGVKESMPDDVVAELRGATLGEKLRDGVALLRSLAALALNFLLVERKIARFHDRLEDALAEPEPPLAEQGPDQLVAHYRSLERRLLTRWDAPLINDFFAMIFFGALGRLTRQWCSDFHGTLHNDLLCGSGGIISAEPALRIEAMARLIMHNNDAVRLLCEADAAVIRRQVGQYINLHMSLREYLDQFGNRCIEELKLESPTLHDDPLPLYRSIGQSARRLRTAPRGPHESVSVRVRDEAEYRVNHALEGKPVRRGVFQWVLRHARRRVQQRENLRFERTRVFGVVRDLFIELGKRLHAGDLLAQPRDVFYLEVGEVLGFVEGTTTTTNLRQLVELRRSEFAAYHQLPAPADRFETTGPVHLGNAFAPPAPEHAAPSNGQTPSPAPSRTRRHTRDVADAVIQRQAAENDHKAGDAAQHVEQRSGLGCCPGVARGRARLVTDPRHASLECGEILVASRTDPGWIMLFPAAAAIVVEHGSLLSHSAIVAREMGIPTVVSVAGVMGWLHDGDTVEVDGRAGVVRKINTNRPDAGAAKAKAENTA